MEKDSYVKPELKKNGNVKDITQSAPDLVCSLDCPGGGGDILGG